MCKIFYYLIFIYLFLNLPERELMCSHNELFSKIFYFIIYLFVFMYILYLIIIFIFYIFLKFWTFDSVDCHRL